MAKQKLPKVISRAEAAELIALADDGTRYAARNVLLLTLMYRAGLRVSEACAIRPRQVERDGIIKLYDAKGGDGTAYFTPSQLLPALDRYLEARTRWLPDADGSVPLIVNTDGSSVTVRYVQRLVKRLKEKAGLYGIVTPHVFRHTYATELIEDGYPLHEVQRLMRHRNIATTEVYLHVRDESLRAKIARRGSTEGGGKPIE